MATALPIRSGNPVLSDTAFRGTAARTGESVMTIQGTVEKTLLALAILVVAAGYTWNQGAGNAGGMMMLGVLGGFAAAMATTFRPTWAPITTPIYAALEGFALGGISIAFETRYPGLVGQAVFLTFGTLGVLLVAYRAGVLRATDQFRRIIVAATGGIMVFYLASFVLGFFGVGMPLIHGNGPLGIVFSLVVTAVAAFNLVLDFDFIERGADRGAPKYMEWYGAFGLLVTLVWLYMEMLRLLSKLQDRR